METEKKRKIYFFKIGGFSQVNRMVTEQLNERFPEHEFRVVDIAKDIVGPFGSYLHMRALTEALVRYGSRIFLKRIPPQDFFPRLPCVLSAIREWTARNVHPGHTAFTFQTQSLFDARREGVHHFVYTDHTYLANQRYEHPQPPLQVSGRWKQMERLLYQKANLNFTFSQFAADSIMEDYGVPSTQVQCVYSGPAVEFPLEIDTSRRKGLKILSAMTDWKRKGGRELLQAFALVRREIPEAELVIIGKSDLSIPGVTAKGWVPVEGLKSYYEEADIFCLPSRRDPSASVLVEAAAYSLPIVATSVGGNKERVVEGKTGFLVSPGNVEDLAKRLCRLLRDKTLQTEMGRQGRQRALDTFHWSGIMDRMTDSIRRRIQGSC